MTNLKLPTFVLIAMHCATGVHGQQAENCFQFRDALIHAKPKGTDTRISLKIYGLIEDQQEATANDDSKLRLLRADWSQHHEWKLHNWSLSTLNSTEWIPIDIDVVFTPKQYNIYNYFFNVSVKTQQRDPIFHTKKEIYVETKDLYLDFKFTRGMRWAIHCQPNEPTQSNASNDATPTQGNFPDGIIKMEYFFTLAAVCGILVITNVILCCIIRSKGKQQRRQHTAQTNALSETNAAEPGIVGREGNGQGAVYDYIDIQDLHNYLAKASSENNLADSHVDAKVMQTATSHTSINSIYGYNNDVAICNTDSGRLRKFSHTSENSLYGCH
ncbi:uncharacterized protein LOC135196356 [Macrobrachium nipponense]|uniref:uncharacterized protein LOC135196356 n=1 Tax=Macrobrachium nipponense TaxID=159736 RepID=UPI0030C85451